MTRLIGYARVSSFEQNLDLQLDALKKAGCDGNNIFVDKVSGTQDYRSGLGTCLDTLQANDTLVVWRLDRLGRSMSHLVQLIEELLSKKVAFRSLCDGAIDTTTASGELVFNIFSALAQFEKRLIQERTRAGLVAARARGRKGGRKSVTSKSPRVQMAKQMYSNHSMDVTQICQTLNISKATFYRYLNLTDDEN